VDEEAIPQDYVSFVTTHARQLTLACHEVTGNDKLADSLRLDLLAIVALRWRRWWRPARRRPQAALQLLDHMLRRDRAGAPTVGRLLAPVGSPVLLATAEDRGEGASVATAAWRRSRDLRRQSLLNLVAAALILAVLALVGPGLRPTPTPTAPKPAPLPAGVTLLPRYANVVNLGHMNSALPAQLSADHRAAEALPTLAAAPVRAAIALFRADLGPLVVVARDGARRVDSVPLAGALLVSTSLSPAGDRVVLIRDQSLVIVDLGTGSLREVPAGVMQPILAWRTDHSVIVPGPFGAREVDLDTGTISPLVDVSAADVVNGPSAQLTELVTLHSTSGPTPRIRLWRKYPDAASSASPRDVEDRPIFGPQWIGSWVGTAWSSPVLFARGCAAKAVSLPARFGKPLAAVGTVQPNGIHAGTLVSVDADEFEVLGFVQPHVVLVAARWLNQGTVILAWNPGSRTVNLVTTVSPDARISVADLIPASTWRAGTRDGS
jgi:hypothetical protein